MAEATLYWCAGETASLAEALELWQQDPPRLSWIEHAVGVPKGKTKGPVTEVLLAGWPPVDLALDEARLYWPDHAVQLNREGEQWVWFAFGDVNKPGWKAIQVEREKSQVMPWSDWNPFPAQARPILLKEGQTIPLIEYFDLESGQRLQWRILPWDVNNEGTGGNPHA